MEKVTIHRKKITRCRHCGIEELWYASDGKDYWYTTEKLRDIHHICPDGEFRKWKTQFPYSTRSPEELIEETEDRLDKLFHFRK